MTTTQTNEKPVPASAPERPAPPVVGGGAVPHVIIEAKPGWKLIDWREIREYRDLLYFLVLRDVTVLYKQTVLGIAWAVLTPFFSMVVFSVIFGRLLNVGSDGVPYPVFSFAGLLAWNYFSQTVTNSTSSLIQGSAVFTKVYFPRVFIPLVPVLSKLVDLGIAFLFLLLLMAYYGVAPSWNIVFLPLLVALMMFCASGLGMALSALAIQYRDVRHAVGFLTQILLYAAPVVWPVSKVPEHLRLWYGFYPMAGIIEGFRVSLLNTGPMPWDLLATGTISSAIILVAGALYFRRTERFFADVA